MKGKGSMKWEPSYMQPEQMKMLRDIKDDYYNIKKPKLDKHEIEVINNIIVEAIKQKTEIIVTYFENGQFKPFVGHILYADTINKHIRIIDKFQDVHRINLDDIINIQIS
ncbi:YolD-like family protein [Cytobacillus sp. Hm23]